GRTGDGTVGLAPNTATPYSGTSWSAVSEPVMDQYNTKTTASSGGPDWLQSFTAGFTGRMVRLDVMVNSPLVHGPGAGTIRVYAGTGDLDGSALLAEQPYTFHSAYPIFQECVFTTPFAIVAGQKYTYRLTVPQDEMAWICVAPAWSYTRGHCGAAWYSMLFKTWV